MTGIQSLFRRLYERTPEFVVLTARLPVAGPPLSTNLDPDVIVVNSRPTDAQALASFCDARGFGLGWADWRLKQSDHGFICVQNGKVSASGWVAWDDFWVFEIGRWFRSSAEGCYFHGDFVDPHFRGKGLQRALIAARLRIASDARKHWAHAIAWAGNTASIKNYRACGFEISGRLSGMRLGLWQRDRFVRTSSHETGSLVDDNGRILLGSRWRKRHQPALKFRDAIQKQEDDSIEPSS